MKINEPNTGAYNVLLFNENEKKFIFNKYKNAKKTGAQIINITNPEIIKLLANYLKNHKDNEYLFMRYGVGINKNDIEVILRDELHDKYPDIPNGIRKFRHLFGSDIVVDRPVDPRELDSYAYQMGTSSVILLRNYADYKDNKAQPKNAKSLFTNSDNEESDDEYIPEQTKTRSGRVSKKPQY